MIRITHPTKVAKGSTALPASKSISNRALIIRALCKQPFNIHNLSFAEDTKTLQHILAEKPMVADVGDAGTAMRFLLAYYCTQEKETTLTGSARMQQRPIGPLVDALRGMSADITYTGGNEGYAPVKIKGSKNLKNTVSIRGDVSSQFITALMLIGPTINGGLSIHLQGEVVSQSYIDMTQAMLDYFGIEMEYDDTTITIAEGDYQATNLEIEPDWSAASYFFEVAALAKNTQLMLEHLNGAYWQGDSNIEGLFQAVFGIEVVERSAGIMLQKGKLVLDLEAEYDFTDMPDMAQTVACTAAAMRIPFNLTGLKTLRIKETDRIAALKNELQKTGAIIDAGADYLNITGFTELPKSVSFNTYNDHRMAMALAPLALVINEVIIEDETVVKKSFPTYWDELKKLGFEITQL